MLTPTLASTFTCKWPAWLSHQKKLPISVDSPLSPRASRGSLKPRCPPMLNNGTVSRSTLKLFAKSFKWTARRLKTRWSGTLVKNFRNYLNLLMIPNAPTLKTRFKPSLWWILANAILWLMIKRRIAFKPVWLNTVITKMMMNKIRSHNAPFAWRSLRRASKSMAPRLSDLAKARVLQWDLSTPLKEAVKVNRLPYSSKPLKTLSAMSKHLLLRWRTWTIRDSRSSSLRPLRTRNQRSYSTLMVH